jgi:hypothetical protein
MMPSVCTDTIMQKVGGMRLSLRGRVTDAFRAIVQVDTTVADKLLARTPACNMGG